MKALVTNERDSHYGEVLEIVKFYPKSSLVLRVNDKELLYLGTEVDFLDNESKPAMVNV